LEPPETSGYQPMVSCRVRSRLSHNRGGWWEVVLNLLDQNTDVDVEFAT